ncbi:MAG: APC family permease [Anaerolineales bacterium]|nr:APC family permease [Anaerolineales bacterium]
MNTVNLRRILFGEPFPTSREAHERLDKVRALAVFASDPISSNAYATEAIMSVLLLLGTAALRYTLPLGLAVAALVLMVIFSYIQTIIHYPDGGGAYTVTKDNLGKIPSLVAAGALLTDYILTVSVSAAAGVRAVTSAFPDLTHYRVIMALAAIAFITWVNLRGVRESGTIFAIPTYAFVGGVLLVVIIGLVRYWGWFGATPIVPEVHEAVANPGITGFAYTWLLLRAFAGGCTALTGIEAISNGTKAFKTPESKNAAQTMVAMGVMAMALFIGITYLSTHLGLIPEPAHGESILSQMTREITGKGFMYYWVQVFTALILFLAANTGFQDFPRLSSFLSKDGYMPRWMQNRWDRLVYGSGIITLAIISSIIVIVFQADEIAMLPLYALGVMLSFSLSQTGMFKLMGKISKLKPGEVLETKYTKVHYETGTGWKRAVNGVGAVTTFLVLIVLIATKFVDGAWIIVLAVPLLVWLFISIDSHYQNVRTALRTHGLTSTDFPEIGEVVIVPIGDVNRCSLQALKYAKRLSNDVRAVFIVTGQETQERFVTRWNRFPDIIEGVKLEMLEYDYRDILTPLVEYIEDVNNTEFANQVVTVVIPEFVSDNVWENLLHNQTANLMRMRLQAHKDIVLIDVPYQIGQRQALQARQQQENREKPVDLHSMTATVTDKHEP